MKIVKMILLGIFDPISTFITKSFPDFAYKVLNKSIFIQIFIAILITLFIMFLGTV